MIAEGRPSPKRCRRRLLQKTGAEDADEAGSVQSLQPEATPEHSASSDRSLPEHSVSRGRSLPERSASSQSLPEHSAWRGNDGKKQPESPNPQHPSKKKQDSAARTPRPKQKSSAAARASKAELAKKGGAIPEGGEGDTGDRLSTPRKTKRRRSVDDIDTPPPPANRNRAGGSKGRRSDSDARGVQAKSSEGGSADNVTASAIADRVVFLDEKVMPKAWLPADLATACGIEASSPSYAKTALFSLGLIGKEMWWQLALHQAWSTSEDPEDHHDDEATVRKWHSCVVRALRQMDHAHVVKHRAAETANLHVRGLGISKVLCYLAMEMPKQDRQEQPTQETMTALAKLGRVSDYFASLPIPRCLTGYLNVWEGLMAADAIKEAMPQGDYVWPWFARARLVSRMRAEGIKKLGMGKDEMPLETFTKMFPDSKAIVKSLSVADGKSLTTVKQLFGHIGYKGPPELFTMWCCFASNRYVIGVRKEICDSEAGLDTLKKIGAAWQRANYNRFPSPPLLFKLAFLPPKRLRKVPAPSPGHR